MQDAFAEYIDWGEYFNRPPDAVPDMAEARRIAPLKSGEYACACNDIEFAITPTPSLQPLHPHCQHEAGAASGTNRISKLGRVSRAREADRMH